MEDNTERLWHSILGEIKSRVRTQQFNTWFNNLQLRSCSDEAILIEVPNFFYKEWLENHYLPVIRSSVDRIAPTSPKISFVVNPSLMSNSGPEDERIVLTNAGAPTDGDQVSWTGSRDHAPWGRRLNRSYVFDNFVVGPNNRLAHAAARAVAESPPSRAYNPLFVYGAVGLGKTHLVQAASHYVLQRSPEAKLLYMPCEDFVNEFIRSVGSGQMESFRYKYRYVDYLLIDDIHSLASKDSTQEEFFHTFNALHNDGKQIILSSDSPPQEIPTLEERLVSRFSWGLVTRIDSPPYETRVAILKKKASARAKILPDDVIDFLATHITTNIRYLEGAVIRVVGYASLDNRKIDVNLAKEALRDIINLNEHPTTIEDIINVVTKQFNVRVSDLQSKKRSKSVTFPRQICMYLARKMTSYSLEEVGGYFGGRDHTTVLHACDKIQELIETDEDFARLMDKVTVDVKKR